MTVDNVGQVLQTGEEVVAAIDFDWHAMGVSYAEYWAANYPGKKVAIIAGLLDHLPVQIINGAMQQRPTSLARMKLLLFAPVNMIRRLQ